MLYANYFSQNRHGRDALHYSGSGRYDNLGQTKCLSDQPENLFICLHIWQKIAKSQAMFCPIMLQL